MDRINVNVFRQMRDQKHGKKTNDIYAKPKPKNTNQKFTRPTGAYTLNSDQPQPQMGMVPKNQNQNSIQRVQEQNDEPDLYYANPNNYTTD